MKPPAAHTGNRRRLEVAMTPMIDVVFLLLVFFVWTASFQIVEQVLPSTLSEAQGNQPVKNNDPPPPEMDFDNVVIRLNTDGQVLRWQLNNQAVESLEQMRTRLVAIAEIKSDAPVILHPDDNVPLGDVIDVYDLSRVAGFEKVQFVTSPEL